MVILHHLSHLDGPEMARPRQWPVLPETQITDSPVPLLHGELGKHRLGRSLAIDMAFAVFRSGNLLAKHSSSISQLLEDSQVLLTGLGISPGQGSQ